MATSKKIHPADAADLALIPACKKFTATILKNNKPQTTEHPSLAAARIEAMRLNATANNGRKALVYAITDEGRAILVPASYGSEAKPEPKADAKPEPKAVAKPAKPVKAAKPAKAAKKAKPKGDGKSKVEIVIAMLTGRKAVTRKDIAEAVEWSSFPRSASGRGAISICRFPIWRSRSRRKPWATTHGCRIVCHAPNTPLVETRCVAVTAQAKGSEASPGSK